MSEINENTMLIDVPYPRNFLETVKKGKKLNVWDLATQGVVFSFTFFKEGEAEKFLEQIRLGWDEQKVIFCDLDDTQKRLDETVELAKLTQKPHSVSNYVFSLFLVFNNLGSKEEQGDLLGAKIATHCFLDGQLAYEVLFVSTRDNLLKEPFYTTIEILYRENCRKYLTPRKEKTERKPRDVFTKSIRHEVLKKYNYRCVECGVTNQTSSLQIDHILPVSRGGTDELDNLQILCETCNLAKKNRIFSAPPSTQTKEGIVENRKDSEVKNSE